MGAGPVWIDPETRVGLAATPVFLAVNGRPLHVSPEDLYRMAMAVGDEKVRMTEPAVAEWIRARR